MEIIGKTENGFLIQATNQEVKNIISAVIGKVPEKIGIGQKLPAIDYAATITKIKTLSEDYDFTQIYLKLENFKETAEKLKEVVIKAKDIDL
jgi:effector-binding domain-containing protein